jgi:hypothetical protein
MIRRLVDDEFLLIPQDEHAKLSGLLAAHFGNRRFDPPTPREPVVEAIRMHDCGWPKFDARPSLNPDGYPLDVFESLHAVAIRAWEHAGDVMHGRDPYAQLLVSLHTLGLSGFAANHVKDRTAVFELNRFQHREIERQERLRRILGMSLETPLKLGLAIGTGDEHEERLRRNHWILQAMDRISLAACATEMPFDRVDNIVPREKLRPAPLLFSRSDATAVRVEPWPFDEDALALDLAVRRVPARAYRTPEDFLAVYDAAPDEPLRLTVHS